mmetsp:Transcript_21286/g.44623  ORF Transcript_21286/g.44623 Transcript_21286/m.44623 type:complete len:981 (-) Transcript_21286:1345-4287(-)
MTYLTAFFVLAAIIFSLLYEWSRYAVAFMPPTSSSRYDARYYFEPMQHFHLSIPPINHNRQYDFSSTFQREENGQLSSRTTRQMELLATPLSLSKYNSDDEKRQSETDHKNDEMFNATDELKCEANDLNCSDSNNCNNISPESSRPNNIPQNDPDIRDDSDDIVLGMESGWTNFARQWGGRNLIPSSSAEDSTSLEPTNSSTLTENNNTGGESVATSVDVASYDPKTRGNTSAVDPIFFWASTFASDDDGNQSKTGSWSDIGNSRENNNIDLGTQEVRCDESANHNLDSARADSMNSTNRSIEMMNGEIIENRLTGEKRLILKQVLVRAVKALISIGKVAGSTAFNLIKNRKKAAKLEATNPKAISETPSNETDFILEGGSDSNKTANKDTNETAPNDTSFSPKFLKTPSSPGTALDNSSETGILRNYSGRKSFSLVKGKASSNFPKWERRKQRVLVLFKAAKSAIILLVFTFLAGNIMNQFVDLDEDGSFEVRFGKVLSATSSSTTWESLSSSSPSPSTPSSPATPLESQTQSAPPLSKPFVPKHETPRKRGAGLFRGSNPSNRRYVAEGAQAQALGLVSRAVQKQGPAVVRVETETDLGFNSDTNNSQSKKSKSDKNEKKGDTTDENNGEGTNSNGDVSEDRGDVFDGVPEAPPPSDGHSGKNTDFGQGSGIIIDREGYILTNAHVVDGATRIYVLLTDGRRFPVVLRGSDDIVDVAVLQIVPDMDSDGFGVDVLDNIPVAELGDSDYMEVGQFVVAVGSPGGLDNTCTIGIVSGLKRCPKVVGIPDKTGVLDYIQTDAAINQGNSGGPLVDVESGKIVGINTCIRANMEGTSFAIPINKVMGVVQDLSEGKQITHGYLGVHMSTMSPSLARYYNKLQQNRKIPEREGVMIEKVFKNSPAQEGGLKKFDFVIEIEGRPVEKADDAHVIIDRAPIGEELSMTILRENTELVIKVKPEDLSPRLKQLREERLKRKAMSKE